MGEADPGREPSLGVIVPARNEGKVIERRLRSLIGSSWPAGVDHYLVVVDDGSADDTAERARTLLESAELPAGLNSQVIVNDRTAGKPGAVRCGLARLGSIGSGTAEGHGVDVVVLTDADVVTHPDALLLLSTSFRGDARLGLACGGQSFVAELPASGKVPDSGRDQPRPAAGLYDRLTARVRRLESRLGRLFSVHGQLLAWRAELGLEPRDGIAADDLDLLLQLRSHQRPGGAWQVRLVPEARFYEQKTPPGPAAREQALRRARAYFQVLRLGAPEGMDLAGRLQWLCYRYLPALAPELALAGSLAVLFLVHLLAGSSLGSGPAGMIAAGAGLLLLWASPPGRRLLRLLLVIARARRMERTEGQAGQWDMPREGVA